MSVDKVVLLVEREVLVRRVRELEEELEIAQAAVTEEAAHADAETERVERTRAENKRLREQRDIAVKGWNAITHVVNIEMQGYTHGMCFSDEGTGVEE